MPSDHIHRSLVVANCDRKNPEVRLAFLLGFLAGSLQTVKAKNRSQKKFLIWTQECHEESQAMLKEFDEELLAELNFRKKTQGN